ncbi:SAM-dependent methyltransferase [uncultured Paraglaciecola sp.]|uniref:tRNA (guanine(46)-N(7))-methyltransferase TrmB n=1 Tax=uncultured Paraglaciecola sp. TaxID=1765024 RepID=UPI002594991F|nr:SAM-dependent methyltransferase [uncultured Paraglaciecola sp.]
MKNSARSITTNQVGIHQNLEKVVQRHLNSSSQKPLSNHTKDAFIEVLEWLGDWQGPLILDSCCGVGESTANIALAHPETKVIGVDKSALRTQKHHVYSAKTDNYLVVRADLQDFLRLLVLEEKQLYKHYLLYPNPYPKSAHLQRRWYASSTFTDIIKLGGIFEVRSNWKLYIEEFAQALLIANIQSNVTQVEKITPMTPFERKYWESGQDSWKLISTLATN